MPAFRANSFGLFKVITTLHAYFQIFTYMKSENIFIMKLPLNEIGFPRMDRLFWWKVEKKNLWHQIAYIYLLILSDDNNFIKDLFWKATRYYFYYYLEIIFRCQEGLTIPLWSSHSLFINSRSIDTMCYFESKMCENIFDQKPGMLKKQ